MRVRLTVEYDGTGFAGFQLQGRGERTVQGVLESAVQRISATPDRVHGAGRTDAGVHALGQVVHFDTNWTVPENRIGQALNYVLPRDLVVRQATVVDESFHARYNATARIYRYTILNRPMPSAMLSRFALHQYDTLHLAAMQEAALELIGTHDFAAFGTTNVSGQSSVRRMYGLTIARRRDCVLITVRGNAFLRQMVRAFVQVLLLVGQGRLTPGDVREIRDSRQRSACPGIAPAHGLCLVKVEYSGKREVGGGVRGDVLPASPTSVAPFDSVEDTENEDLFGEAE